MTNDTPCFDPKVKETYQWDVLTAESKKCVLHIYISCRLHTLVMFHINRIENVKVHVIRSLNPISHRTQGWPPMQTVHTTEPTECIRDSCVWFLKL